MCMKGGSSMLALTAVGDSQLCFAFFWVVLLAWALLSLAAIYWLRKGLVHLPASRLLPIEYGTVTTTSVLGGLVVYQAHKGVPLNSFLPPSLPSLNAVTCPELLPSSLYSFLQSCDQEHKYVPVSPNLSVMGFGIGLICIGCALVGRRKTLKRKYMPHQLGRQAVRQGAQACGKAAHRDACPRPPLDLSWSLPAGMRQGGARGPARSLVPRAAHASPDQARRAAVPPQSPPPPRGLPLGRRGGRGGVAQR